MSNYFAKNILYLRKVNNLTQEKAASSLALLRSTYGNYENGNTEPAYDLLIDFAKFFGVTIDELLTVDMKDVHQDLKQKKGKIVNSDVNSDVNSLPVNALFSKEVHPFLKKVASKYNMPIQGLLKSPEIAAIIELSEGMSLLQRTIETMEGKFLARLE